MCHDKTRETTRIVKGSYRYGAAELKVSTRKNMLACLYVYGWVHFPAEAGLQALSMAHLAQLLERRLSGRTPEPAEQEVAVA